MAAHRGRLYYARSQIETGMKACPALDRMRTSSVILSALMRVSINDPNFLFKLVFQLPQPSDAASYMFWTIPDAYAFPMAGPDQGS